MPSILNIAAYRFAPIDDPAVEVVRLRARCQTLALRGTVLVAPEGINLFLAGDRPGIHQFLDELEQDRRFAGIQVKFSESQVVPFRRLRVRLKREIITFRNDALIPSAARAPAVAPEQLRDWLRAGHDGQGREMVLLDTRNREEVALGGFDGALALPIDKFTELPGALEPHRAALAGKTIVSYCTGGIRCEKAALWMQQAGYGNVLQLEGGILGYFEQVGGEGYAGGCFVFDDRIALGPDLQPLAEGDFAKTSSQ